MKIAMQLIENFSFLTFVKDHMNDAIEILHGNEYSRYAIAELLTEEINMNGGYYCNAYHDNQVLYSAMYENSDFFQDVGDELNYNGMIAYHWDNQEALLVMFVITAVARIWSNIESILFEDDELDKFVIDDAFITKFKEAVTDYTF